MVFNIGQRASKARARSGTPSLWHVFMKELSRVRRINRGGQAAGEDKHKQVSKENCTKQTRAQFRFLRETSSARAKPCKTQHLVVTETISDISRETALRVEKLTLKSFVAHWRIQMRYRWRGKHQASSLQHSKYKETVLSLYLNSWFTQLGQTAIWKSKYPAFHVEVSECLMVP